MSKILILVVIATSFALNACTAIVENIPGTYSIDIQQGNIFNQEIVDQLRPDMNKRQILYIMGTPMLRDIFHQKRWEYIYFEQLGGQQGLQKRLSLYFEDDKLIGVQGDFRPSSISVLRSSKEVTIELPQRQLKQTISDKIVEMFTFGDYEPPVIMLKTGLMNAKLDGHQQDNATEAELGQQIQAEIPKIPMDTSETDAQDSTDSINSNSEISPSPEANPALLSEQESQTEMSSP